MITSFQTYVVPSVQTLYSKLLVLGDEHDRAILANDKTLDGSIVETRVYFKASYADEWVQELSSLERFGGGYPFIFINTNGLTQSGNEFTIRELVVATQSSDKWTAEERREHVINPILLNLRDCLISSIADVFAVDEPFNPMTEVIYSRENSRLPAGVDAVLFTNVKLREINSCQPTTY